MSSNNLALTASFLPHITNKVMENWRFFTNTLNLFLRNFMKGSRQLGQLHQVLARDHVTPHLTTTATPFFLVYGSDPNLPPQLLKPMQQFLCDLYSRCLVFKPHCLVLAIPKKTLEENRFKHAQKTTNCTPPNFKFGKSIL